MQISVLPVSTPNRPGPTGSGGSEALGFEDVLNGLQSDSERPDSGGSGLPGSADVVSDKTETVARDKSETSSDVSILAVDPTLPAGVPAPRVDAQHTEPALLAGSPSPLRAGHLPGDKSANPVTSSKAGMSDPGALIAAGLVLDAAPKTTDVATTRALADTTSKGRSRVAEATPKGASGDGAVASAARPLPALPAAHPTLTQTAQTALQPDTLAGADSVTTPDLQQKGQGDPALSTPELSPSSTLLAGTAKPEGAKSAFGAAELTVLTRNVDPLGANQTVLPDEAMPTKGTTSAGQPSLTAAIQMLTRNDVLPSQGPEVVPRLSAGIAQLLRTGHQEDRAPASTAPTKSAFADAVALATGQPIANPARITMAGRAPDAEPLLPPTAPKIATAPEAPKTESTAPKPAATPPVVVDMGFDALRSVASLDLPAVSSQSGSASSFATAPQLPASVTPQALGQTIVQVLQKGEERQIDLALRPEELGRLRFEMTTSGDKVHIVLFIERPEALDLIRRHADHLLNDLRQAGFSQSSLSFGNWSQRESPTGGEAATTAPTEEPTDTLALVPPARFSPVTAIGRLDIRL
jgi:flagellar hook-length control protein FliK